jgi:Glycogen recognition site of AMP-activated protein kinase
MQRIAEARDTLGVRVPRAVPVVWAGLASEVRLMGAFDGWSEGVLLSSDAVDDHVFKRFATDVHLLPGRYSVKFLVDGEWRLAAGWPTEKTPDGDTNNVLIVGDEP